ncbi:MAG: metallophosphoesterase, partial [Myxococcota bacterium]
NHEDKTDRAQPYLDVYYLPEQAMRPEDQERYYSFDYGDIHFVSVDSNDGTLIPIGLDITGSIDNDMLDWLAQDLAESDATWKIAFFHHPPFTSSSRSANVTVRNFLLPILEEGGVDLVLAGHDHHYERTLPIREGCIAQRDDSAITYIVAGGGGAGLRGDVTPEWWHVQSDDAQHSYVELDVHGCVATIRAIGSSGETIDEYQLNGCE